MKKRSSLWSLLGLLAMAAAAYFVGVHAGGWSRQLAAIGAASPDYRSITAQAGGPLVLISTSSCPWCARARGWLRAQGLVYRDCVLDQMQEREAVLASTDSSAVPQLISAQGRVIGYDAAAYARLVQTSDLKVARPDPGAWACVDGAGALPTDQAKPVLSMPTSAAPSKASVGRAVRPKPKPRDLGSLT